MVYTYALDLTFPCPEMIILALSIGTAYAVYMPNITTNNQLGTTIKFSKTDTSFAQILSMATGSTNRFNVNGVVSLTYTMSTTKTFLMLTASYDTVNNYYIWIA